MMRFVFAWITLILSALPTWAGGIRTSYSDVWVDHARIGRSTPARDTDGHDFILKNAGTMPLTMVLQPLSPTSLQLKPVAIPLPNLHWIQITPSTLSIAPGAEARAKITIHVPKNLLFANHVYQVMIWSHPAESSTQGITVSPALLSRLRFRTITN